MTERIIHLRVKIKNLADEARTIREEARKTSGMVKWGLNHHRKTTVRWAARDNLLAYGLLRRVPYSAIEKHTEDPPNFKDVEKIARRFGGEDEEIVAWIEEAQVYLKQQKERLRIAS